MQVLKRKHTLDDSIVRMDGLTTDDSWKLFCEHAFKGVDIPRQLDETVVSQGFGQPLTVF